MLRKNLHLLRRKYGAIYFGRTKINNGTSSSSCDSAAN